MQLSQRNMFLIRGKKKKFPVQLMFWVSIVLVQAVICIQ